MSGPPVGLTERGQLWDAFASMKPKTKPATETKRKTKTKAKPAAKK